MKNFKIELAPSVTLTEIEGRLVLFSKKTGDFFGLNESALALIKKLLDSDFFSTLQQCSKEFDVLPATLEADLLSLLAELERQKLLKKVEIP